MRRKTAAKPATLIAYDFETTRIAKGTPRPLYITAYSERPNYALEMPIRNMQHLHDLLAQQFLIPEFDGVKYVAWNANNFDAYFVAASLITDPVYTMRPYLTKSNSLRGLRVLLTEHIDSDGEYMKGAPSWEFLDGMAMLGFVGVSLEKFLDNFAPDHKKMKGVIDFEKETFDANNPQHRAYAMRDSVGLYHGMVSAQNILLDRFNQPLTVTMGGACIKIFQANMPEDVKVFTPPEELLNVVRLYAMRGGFCYCVKRYHGPVWKYDLNQAYAAAMREAKLPSGQASHCTTGLSNKSDVYIARITATNPQNKIPFYHRMDVGGRVKAAFSLQLIEDTWLTSIEVQQLQNENWKIEIHESWGFTETFSMKDYVDALEVLRTTCVGGPAGPIGTMAKNVGNHSYGKTVEQLEPINYLLGAEAPPGYVPYYADEVDPIEHVYYRFVDEEDVRPKAYHQPQLGAFITAHVRMVVRRAALLSPDTWLYADTDCVVFSSDVTAQLDIDAKRYGAWKVEEEGTEFQIIAKKVYANLKTGKGSAKGLNVTRPVKMRVKDSDKWELRLLQLSDFNDWYEGIPPTQEQTQRQNFMQVMRGAEMYRTQIRRGTSVEIAK